MVELLQKNSCEGTSLEWNSGWESATSIKINQSKYISLRIFLRLKNSEYFFLLKHEPDDQQIF